MDKSNMMTPNIIERTELKHPSGFCNYCLSRRVYLLPLPCQHSYCAKCLVAMLKICKLKKNVPVVKYGEEAIKCPQCQKVHILADEKIQEFVDVINTDDYRKR